VAGSNVCERGCQFRSVQEAIDDPSTQNGDTITISAGNFPTDVSIFKDLTLIGEGSGADPELDTILDGKNAGTVLFITFGAVQLKSLRVTGGAGGGLVGGGIHVAPAGKLTLTDCVVTNNTADDGGGIYNERGIVIVEAGTSVTNNTSGDGGGIYNEVGTVTLQTGSSVTGNTAAQKGGGILNIIGTVNVDDATIVTGNFAGVSGDNCSGDPVTPPGHCVN
jgi:hypothetical protein